MYSLTIFFCNLYNNIAGNLAPHQREVLASLGESVELFCELYGYLRSGLDKIVWQFNGIPLDPSLIQVQNGSHKIQNGGASPIPSVLSVVTLQSLTADMFGSYVCLHNGINNAITLVQGSKHPQHADNTETISYITCM